MKEMTMNEDLILLDEVIRDMRYKLRRKEICKKYSTNNIDKCRLARKKWKDKNKERVRETQKLRREKKRLETNKQKYEKPLTKNSPFVRIFANVKNSRKRQCFLTIDNVREQYEKQNGLCAISGVQMKIPKSSGERCFKTPDCASVDRIDSSKEYCQGNIQLVCVSLNYAKNSFTHDEFMKFFNLIRSDNQRPRSG